MTEEERILTLSWDERELLPTATMRWCMARMDEYRQIDRQTTTLFLKAFSACIGICVITRSYRALSCLYAEVGGTAWLVDGLTSSSCCRYSLSSSSSPRRRVKKEEEAGWLENETDQESYLCRGTSSFPRGEEEEAHT